MTYPIVLFGEPVLEKQAETITDFDSPGLHKLIDDMFESMYAAKGVGLAAPQIGISKRLAVIDLSVGEDAAQKLVLINPEIISKEEFQTGEEGCLSIPGFREQVTRPLRVTIRAQDVKGETFEKHGAGTAGARVLPRDRPSQWPPVHLPRQRAEARPDPPQSPQAGKSRRMGRIMTWRTHSCVPRSHSCERPVPK